MKYCKKCGCEMTDDALFCEKCGEKTGLVPTRSEKPVEQKTEKMSDKVYKFVVTFLVTFIVVFAIIFWFLYDNGPKMSLSEFNQIENGMTYEQVKKIVGGGGKLTAETGIGQYYTANYSFEGAGAMGANATVMFQNGRVISKAQYGLK